jgi:hypothetical protein
MLFRDCAREKWLLKGSKHADNLMSQIIGFPPQADQPSRWPEKRPD